MKMRRLTAISIALIAALVIANGLWAAVPQNQAPQQKFKTFEELEAAIAKAQAAGLSNLRSNTPVNDEKWLDLVRLFLMNGQLDNAESNLEEILKQNPKNGPAYALRGNLYRNSFRFEEAFKVLAEAEAAVPDAVPVRLLKAGLAMDRMDFASAQKIYEKLSSENPKLPDALCGLAEVAYWENRFEDSMKLADQGLALDPAFSRAYFLKSLIHRIRQENDLWAAAGRKAVEADPFDADARANLSNILMRGEKKMEEGYVEANLALKINRWNYLAHNYIGNGWSPRDYEDLKIEGDPETVAKIETLLSEANLLLTKHIYGPAREKFDQVLALAPKMIPALLGKASIAYNKDKKDYDQAQDLFTRILDLNPDYGLAHYGLAQTLLRKKDRINIRLAEIEQAFAAKDAPEPPYLRDVFINYKDLDPNLQKIIRFAVKPLRAFLQVGKEKGATFYITPFHLRQSEAPGMANLKGQRTFDLRLWDDVKGLGGRKAMSGEDWERDVKYLRFNVVAHEFAHQIHRMLPAEIQSEIDRLYAKAKAERLTLDFYSDTNVMEYFAVGVEAYVSEDKLADQKIAYGHTRRELLERDPDLYKLIEKLDSKDTPAGT